MAKLSIKELFMNRWKYYLSTYIMGYILSIIFTGIQNMYYLIPIKLFAIAFMLLLGNGFYYRTQDVYLLSIPFRLIKYMILIVVLMALMYNLQQILQSNYGIDITPFIGFEGK